MGTVEFRNTGVTWLKHQGTMSGRSGQKSLPLRRTFPPLARIKHKWVLSCQVGTKISIVVLKGLTD